MLQKILKTRDDYSITVLRIALGLVMLPHGAQKLLGLFGGYGFSGTMHFFTVTMGIPYIFALMAILAESIGTVGIIAGFFTRVCAFGIGTTMVVAVLMVHIKNGFFMNWFGTQAGEGFEYHILAVGMALTLIIAGGGRYSIDSLITTKEQQHVLRK